MSRKNEVLDVYEEHVNRHLDKLIETAPNVEISYCAEALSLILKRLKELRRSADTKGNSKQ